MVSKSMLWQPVVGLALGAVVAAGVALPTLAGRDDVAVRPITATPSLSTVLFVTGSGLADAAQATVDGLTRDGRVVLHKGVGFAEGDAPLTRAIVDDVQIPRLAAIVVQGGEQDVSSPPGVTAVAVLHMIDRLRSVVPVATSLTVVGPLPAGEPDEALLRVRSEIEQACATKRVHFVDPIALGLRRGQDDLAVQLRDTIAPFIPR